MGWRRRGEEESGRGWGGGGGVKGSGVDEEGVKGLVIVI